MNYLTKFDSSGKRITSYPLDDSMTDKQYAELINEGYIEISEEDWNYYVGNKGQGKNGTGYIRGKDGKPTDAPAYVPSKEEQLAQLDSQYNADKAELTQYFAEAVLADDTETQSELRQELEELNAEYTAKRKEIEENIND